MGNTNAKTENNAVTAEDYELKIKALEKELSEKDKTIKNQADQLEKLTEPTQVGNETLVKNFVSEKNHKKYTVKLKINRQLGDKVVKVNDKEYIIKRGVNVEVPEWVKECLDHEEDMELADYNHQEQVNAKLSMF